MNTPQQQNPLDITDNSESPDSTDCPSISILKQPLNSRHPARYNGQLSRSQLYANNT